MTAARNLSEARRPPDRQRGLESRRLDVAMRQRKERIAEGRNQLHEASPLDLKAVPKDKLGLFKKLGLKPAYAFGSPSMLVLTARVRGARFSKDLLKVMVSDPNFRWLEITDDEVHMGL